MAKRDPMERRRTRLAVLEPVGDVFVNGLASAYDDDYPAASLLAAYVTPDEFAAAMTKINEALLDHWPCLPCTSFAYGCCICTLGLSFYCATSQVREAESRVQLQLRRLNEQTAFKTKGVEWRLVRTWYCRSSYVEVLHVEDGGDGDVTETSAATESSASESGRQPEAPESQEMQGRA